MKLGKLLVILCAVFILSCKKENSDPAKISPTPTFLVDHKEEKMPVWVEGKADAAYIILAVHGGPGSDALDFRNYKGGLGFRDIEKSYLVAYWQQRAAGQSIGPNKTSYYTISQYVEDCDKVVDELKKRYTGKKVILLGHSWGGMLTSSYLSDPTRRSKIHAWIDAAGVINGATNGQQSINALTEEADRRIQKNENVAYWQNIKTKIKGNAAAANIWSYDCLEKVGEVTIKVNTGDFKYTSRAISSNMGLFKEIEKTNNALALANFKLPTLILAAKFDFAVPKAQTDEVASKVGATKVKSVLFESSGHYMMFHEPGKFAASIVDFIKDL